MFKTQKLFGLLLLAIALSSCSSTNYLTMTVTEPAPVTIPSHIKSIGIVNRSIPTDKTGKKLDKADKILSIEGKNLDKDGAERALLGLFDELNFNTRFSEVKIIDDVNIKNPGLSTFPASLKWDEVTRICEENNVDALFILSFYDTDTRVDYAAVPVEIAGPLGIKVPAIEHRATLFTLIKSGWRIYDEKNKLLLDEIFLNNEVVSKGVGINPMKAVEAVRGRKEAVMHSSEKLGIDYALRIVPYNLRVRRNYYVRGSDNFKIGKRRAQTGDWDGAADLWYKEIDNEKSKIAGRAYYNMAIINEINGNLDSAIDWASKSYSDFNNKLALDYLKILKNRLRKNQQLQNQMLSEQ